MNRLKTLTCFLPALFIFSLSNGQNEELSLSLALDKSLQNNYALIIPRADEKIAAIDNNWGTAGR